jgi:hypothetical protein
MEGSFSLLDQTVTAMEFLLDLVIVVLWIIRLRVTAKGSEEPSSMDRFVRSRMFRRASKVGQ